MKKIVIIILTLSTTIYSLDLNTTIGTGTIGVDLTDGLEMFQNTYITLADIDLYDRNSRMGFNTSILVDKSDNITDESQTSYLQMGLYYNVYDFREGMTLGPYVDCTFFDEVSLNPYLYAGVKFNIFLPLFYDGKHFQAGMNIINSKLGYSIQEREFYFSANTDLTAYALFIFAEIYTLFNP